MEGILSINPHTRKLLANRERGLVPSEDLVEWAASMLEAGLDSENMRILAGLMPPLQSSEVEFYFNRCFDDLKWSFPEREMCLRQYTRDVAEAVLAGSISPSECCIEMYNVYVALGYADDLEHWSILSDDYDPRTYKELDENAFRDAVMREAKTLLSKS